jgi:2'-5' RNA ligase
MPPIRAFIAIELPRETRADLERVAGRLRASAADVRWVKTDDIHLTLKFLGDVEEDRVTEIAGCIEQCLEGIPPFSIAVRGLGAFPSDHNPQVIWIAAEDASGRLSLLERSLEDGLSRMGFKKEKRPFSPHFTLGRLKSPRGKEAVRRGLVELKNTDCGSYTAEAVCLFKSDLRPSGPIYTVLKSFSLHTHN